MTVLPYWITSQIPYYKDLEAEQAEEIRKIKEKAERYDSLIKEAGHFDFLNVMKERVDAEIAEATAHPLDKERQQLHVVRWNAMRELLDAGMGDINVTRKERDRINKEEFDFFKNRKFGEDINV